MYVNSNFKSHRISLTAFLPAIMLAGFAATAQDLPANCPSKPTKEKAARVLAGKWFKKAERAYAKRRFKRSVRAFRCSMRMAEHPVVYSNAAQAAVLAEDKESALEFYRRYLELAPDSDSAEDVKIKIAELEKELGIQAEPVPVPVPVPVPEPEVIPEPEVEPEPEIEPEPETEPTVGLDPLKVTGITLTGVGAAFVVTGAILQGMAGKAKTDSEEAEWMNDFNKAESQMESYQKVAYVGFIAGGAVLVTGVILWAVSGRDDEQGDAAVGLALWPSGLLLKGRF